MPPRTRNRYDPASVKPFRISRSKLDLFLQCPRCFYLDRRLGVSQPSGPPFSLNSAVDGLLKCEFDSYRERGAAHPLMVQNGIDAVPFRHARLEEWRDSLRRGISSAIAGTNLEITGGVDDVWESRTGELYIVDYKATAKAGEVSLDAEWQIAYKRQVEVYQWLFRKNGFTVSNTAYFVYCNGDLKKGSFEGCLHFSIKVIPYEGNAGWVDDVVNRMYVTLQSDRIPCAGEGCDLCEYRSSAAEVEGRRVASVV
jgi:hypothetical protein